MTILLEHLVYSSTYVSELENDVSKFVPYR